MAKRLPILTPQEIERFWSHVDKRGPDDCWLWTAAIIRRYGGFHLRRQMFRANRVALFLTTGVDPYPLLACHSCDTPLCCNGAHLFAATNDDNMADMVRKGRAASGERHVSRLYPERVPRGDRHGFRKSPDKAPRGENNGNSRLLPEDIVAIREAYSAGGATQNELSAIYSVSRAHIGYIVTRKSWKHIP